MMKESFSSKHPVILSLTYVIILSIFVSVATIISMVYKMTQSKTMILQTCSFLLSTTVALIIMVKSKYSLKEYGFSCRWNTGISWGLVIIPIIVLEAITFIVGINTNITFNDAIVLVLFLLAAVIHEEIYFRGLILKTLSVKGKKFAIIVSSLLFGISHLGSISNGKGISHTILLVAVSTLFAFVTAEIVILTRSLFIPIVWHFIRNLISSITLEASNSITLIIVSAQCTILLMLSVYLWIKIKKKTTESN